MGATKTIKVGMDAYNVIQQMSEATGGSLTDVATALIGGAMQDFHASLKELSATLAEGESRVASPVTLPGALKGADGQLGNPHDNTEKVESAEAVAEAVAEGTPDIDESGERGEGTGLASTESENESGSLGGALVSLGFLAFLAYWRWQQQGGRGSLANRGVM